VDAVQAALKGRSLHLKFLKAGKVVAWGRYTVSTDGKLLSATEEDATASEHGKIVYHAVFERQ
jgi:hypothetical protein